MADEQTSDRSRLLLAPQQRTPDEPMVRSEGARAHSAARVDLLVAFTRALIRHHPSGDAIMLSLYHAQHETGASDEEVAVMTEAVLGEAAQSPWPKGFF